MLEDRLSTKNGPKKFSHYMVCSVHPYLYMLSTYNINIYTYMYVHTQTCTDGHSRYTMYQAAKGGKALVGSRQGMTNLSLIDHYLSSRALLSITTSCVGNSSVGRGHLDQVTETLVGITITTTYSCKYYSNRHIIYFMILGKVLTVIIFIYVKSIPNCVERPTPQCSPVNCV